MKTKDIEKALIAFEHRAPIRSLRTSALYPFHEVDFLTVSRSNYAVEYEIKVSRSDYLADFKKAKHKTMQKGMGGKISRFFYVVPTDMVDVREVPDYCGLIYVDDHLDCSIIKPAPRLKATKLTMDDTTRIYRSIMFRWLTNESKK